MPDKELPPSLDQKALLDIGFLEHRAKLLDIASFVDRLERAKKNTANDFRYKALLEGIALILKSPKGSPKTIQEFLSDNTEAPIEESVQLGAFGAPKAMGNNTTNL